MFGPAIEAYDSSAIQELAKKEAEAGAAYIDVNAGMFWEDEPERMEWLVKTVQEAVDTPLSIDTRNKNAIKRALKAGRNKKPLINYSVRDKGISKIKYELSHYTRHRLSETMGGVFIW